MPVSFPYPTEIEAAMKVLYRSLRENDRRRYAAVEAAKLGHGGLDYLAALLGCDPKSIRHGQQDMHQRGQQPLQNVAPAGRVRKTEGDADAPERRALRR